MNILVTGGAGYIGSHVCKALAKEGYIPITLDNLSTGHQWAVKWGPFFQGDIGDKELVRDILKSYNISGVIHLAAFSNVRESAKSPLQYYQNNVGATLNLVEVLLEKRISNIVFSSTCSVYGMPQKIPIDETHPIAPINTYGQSKWMVEQILQTISHRHQIQVATLRYFNAAGSDIDGEIGEAHDPETHLIPLLIQTALGQHDAFILYGNNHPTNDGTAVRDFIHVTDLSVAHIRALEYLMNKKENLTLNLGTGNGYSVLEMIRHIEAVGGRPLPVKVAEAFPGDPPILVANPKKALELLNWTPLLSTLPKMISTAWDWHRPKITV